MKDLLECKNLPDMLQHWMQESGKMQIEIAAEIGVAKHVMHRIATGKQPPTVRQLAALQRVTGIDGNALLRIASGEKSTDLQ